MSLCTGSGRDPSCSEQVLLFLSLSLSISFSKVTWNQLWPAVPSLLRSGGRTIEQTSAKHRRKETRSRPSVCLLKVQYIISRLTILRQNMNRKKLGAVCSPWRLCSAPWKCVSFASNCWQRDDRRRPITFSFFSQNNLFPSTSACPTQVVYLKFQSELYGEKLHIYSVRMSTADMSAA